MKLYTCYGISMYIIPWIVNWILAAFLDWFDLMWRWIINKIFHLWLRFDFFFYFDHLIFILLQLFFISCFIFFVSDFDLIAIAPAAAVPFSSTLYSFISLWLFQQGKIRSLLILLLTLSSPSKVVSGPFWNHFFLTDSSVKHAIPIHISALVLGNPYYSGGEMRISSSSPHF